jgi:hypothetical protein
VTTETVLQSISYRHTTVTSLSKIDKNKHGDKKDQWFTVYYYSEVREFVPVTVTTPQRVKTTIMVLTTLSKVMQTSSLTEYSVNLITYTQLDTATLTRIFETIFLEESEGEPATQFPTLLKDYWLILIAAIIILLAVIPKRIFKKHV